MIDHTLEENQPMNATGTMLSLGKSTWWHNLGRVEYTEDQNVTTSMSYRNNDHHSKQTPCTHSGDSKILSWTWQDKSLEITYYITAELILESEIKKQ